MITHQTALLYAMVLVSAADGDMKDRELSRIGEVVRHLPVFQEYETSRLTDEARDCANLLAGDDGLERVLDQIVTALPAKLGETAYALACDVAAADGKVTREEARLLEMLRNRFRLDNLAAAAIERGAKARHQTL